MKKIAYLRADDIFNDSRATKEIMALCDAGYCVCVLGWNRTGKAPNECKEVFAEYTNIEFSFYQERVENGIGAKNIRRIIAWFLWLYKKLDSISNLNLVYACDLDTGWITSIICKKRKIPYVYDIYDYYVDSHNLPSFSIHFVENMEIGVINNAALTIICTEERIVQISKAKPKRVIVIYNSPDIPVFYEEVADYDYAYCGEISSRRLMDKIFEKYPQNSDITMCIAGDGPEDSGARELSNKYDNVFFEGIVSYRRVIEIEKKAKSLSAIYNPIKRNHQLCAPNKFYEALALGKPVIVCRGTGIDTVVLNENIGIVIDYDVDEFYKAVRYLRDNPDICRSMGRNGRKLYEKKYDWRYMKELIANEVRAICV